MAREVRSVAVVRVVAAGPGHDDLALVAFTAAERDALVAVELEEARQVVAVPAELGGLVVVHVERRGQPAVDAERQLGALGQVELLDADLEAVLREAPLLVDDLGGRRIELVAAAELDRVAVDDDVAVVVLVVVVIVAAVVVVVATVVATVVTAAVVVVVVVVVVVAVVVVAVAVVAVAVAVVVAAVAR